MKELSAVILAAGISKRLGFDKLTIKINGESVIRKATLPFLSAGVGKIFVVTGVESCHIQREFEKLPVKCIENRNYHSGMSTSVKAALPFIKDAEGAFFHLGDKPFLEEKIIHDMVNMYRKQKKKIIVPVFNDKKGHPVLINAGLYAEEMESLDGDKGLREIIEKHAEDVISIKGNEGSIFDIDTIEDIENLKERGYIIEKS